MTIIMTTTFNARPALLGMILVFNALACSKSENLPNLDQKVSSPTDVLTSEDGKYFFVLNADYDRSFSSGSVLTLDEDGNKKASFAVPRLGRAMALAGNDMLVTIDQSSADEKSAVILIDASNPESLVEKARWELDCAPWNAVIRKDYKYFAVSCIGGRLYMGELKTNRAESTLKIVRDYGRSRRAMHIDTSRNLLFMFPTATNLRRSQISDLEDSDTKTLNETTGDVSDATDGDEIPDSLQSSLAVNRRRRDSRQVWQYVVYNIGTESQIPTTFCDEKDSCGPFPFRKLDTSTNAADKTVQNELRWLYFTLTNINGDPDTASGLTDTSKKLYRTNVWEAKPDPADANSFFISQRGGSTSPYANHIVRVRIKGDPAATSPVAKTNQTLSFERVYGFGGELDAAGRHYPGDFDVVNIKGSQTLLVNHFKDLSGFKRNETYFSIAGKILEEDFWVSELSGDGAGESYFQIAANSRGRAITGAFYGNSVILLDIVPGVGITKRQRIE